MAAWVHRMAGWVKTRPLVKGVMVIAAIGFPLWFIIVLQPDENLTNILQSFGYLEMIPPSNFHGPGTINTIEAISVNKIKLHPTCEMDGQSLASLTRSSLTVDQTTIQKFEKSFNISAHVKSIISVESVGNTIKDILIKLNNVKILLISDEHLSELQKEFIKGNCQEAIVMNLKNGGTVCQTQAVLEADVVYTIVHKENVSMSEREKITRTIAGKFQLEENGGGSDNWKKVVLRGKTRSIRNSLKYTWGQCRKMSHETLTKWSI